MAHDYEKLFEEAKTHGFIGVCVPPYWVKKAARDLKGSGIAVVTVVGFPLGYNLTQAKINELEWAIEQGADELDVVMNLAAFRENPDSWVKPEIAALAQKAHAHGKILKVILETAYLNEGEISQASRLCADAGADFVKTSTGFAPTGAKAEHIRLMKQAVGSQVGVKASGGIKTLQDAIAMLEAGAERLGTSSGVSIMEEWAALQKQAAC
jgi:deoxyribose-phosphate aldolase